MSRCLEVQWHGEGQFHEIGPAHWDTIVAWGKAFRRVQDIDLGRFTAVYAVDCTLGGTHHFLVEESTDDEQLQRLRLLQPWSFGG